MKLHEIHFHELLADKYRIIPPAHETDLCAELNDSMKIVGDHVKTGEVMYELAFSKKKVDE